MRIPLDYYSILGVPIQASTEQVDQAYGDRTQQQPRPEYSEVAIAARKQLLDDAHAVLSDPEQRAEYDAHFFSQTYQSQPNLQNESQLEQLESHTSWIEIDDDQLAGALLILQQLGEYELARRWAESYLSSSSSSLSPESGKRETSQRADIVLTLALADLELCRERWQQGEYEKAASFGQSGQDLLSQECLLPELRGEIEADLYKLRPYRIWELLAQSDKSPTRQGLQLLQQMLEERGGIDRTGDDRSGLSVDQFLRFIQQIRGYLTTTQQQELFEAEAKRPSAVAAYLAVYARIAGGFAYRQPALIAGAKEMLRRLGKQQDVYLEQAVCALLLGQTEEASRALELSQEPELLAFIREKSLDSPDLLPGLCLYGEHWLQTEVFPHFRDLANQQASLKDYFADEQVQQELEELLASIELQNQAAAVESPPQESEQAKRKWITPGVSEQAAAQAHHAEKAVSASTTTTQMATMEPPSGVSTQSTPSQGKQNSPRGSAPKPTSNHPRKRKKPSTSPDSEGRVAGKKMRRDRSRRKRSMRQLLLGFASLLGVAAVGFIAVGAYQRFQNASQLEGEQPSVGINQPPLAIPPPDPQKSVTENLLTPETARRVIQTWLSTKSQALGPDHQIQRLDNILVDPMLSVWRDRASYIQQNNIYRTFQHEVTVKRVNTSEEIPNQARVEAVVREVSKFYEQGQLDRSESYDDKLRVQYDLMRQADQWQIREVQDVEILQEG